MTTASLAAVLRHSALGDVEALCLLVAVGLVATVMLQRGVWRRSVRVGMIVLGAVVVAALAGGAMIWPEHLRALSRESHVVEWLTADLLLIACGVAVAAAIRHRPLPGAVILAAGAFLAFGREMEWGEPFYGEKIIYSRYVFRPKAWFDPSRFDKISALARESGKFGPDGISADALRWMHVSLAALILIIIAAATCYTVRHREVFAKSLRPLWKATCSRLAIAAVALYVAAGLAEEVLEEVLKHSSVSNWATTHAVSGMVLAEPLEMLGAMCLAMAAVAIWHAPPDPAGSDHRL